MIAGKSPDVTILSAPTANGRMSASLPTDVHTASRPRSRHALWAAFALYFAVSLAATWPLARDASTLIAGDPGDPILNTSVLVWNATTLPYSSQYWNAPHFYPTLGATTFTENLLGMYPVASPIYWLTKNPILTYNLTLFICWPLSAFATFLLVRTLSQRDDAAFVAGLAFAFSPMWAVAVYHLQTVATFGVAFMLAGLHGYLRNRRWPWLALFAGAWLQQGLANGYYILYDGLLFGVWLLYFGTPATTRRAAGPILLACVLGSLPLVPLLLNYRAVHDAMGMHRSINEILYFSAHPRSWGEVSDIVWSWGRVFAYGKDNLFPGLTAVLITLSAIGAWLLAKQREAVNGGALGTDYVRTVLLAVLAIGVSALAALLWHGPIDTTVGPFPLKIRGLDRAVVAIVVSTAILGWRSLRVRRALAERSPFVFYAFGIILFGLLACGPVLKTGEAVLLDPAPYGWLMKLPGFNELRVPTQIKMIHLLCLAVASGLAFARLWLPGRTATRIALLVCSAGLLADGWITGMPMAAAQAEWPIAEPAGRTEPILELPLGPDYDGGATLRASRHRRRVMNGVSGYDPPYYEALKAGLRAHDQPLLAAVASLGPIDVVVDGSADPDGAYAKYVAGAPGAREVLTDGTRTVFRLPAQAAPPPLGPALRLSSVRAVHSQTDWRHMHDEDDDTSWIDYPQKGDAWVLADLGDVRTIAGVANNIANFPLDYPHRLAVDVSIDQETWETVFEGPTYAQTFLAFVRNPRRAALEFGFAPRQARFVRLRQLDASATTEWRVAEVTVHAPSTPQ